jgi:signal peptidase II
MRAVPANRYVFFILLAAGGLTADLWTKAWAFSSLGMPGGEQHWLWEGHVGFETSLNEGALFGIGQGQVTLFATLSVVALGGIVAWLFYAGAAQDLLLTIALGMVTGGILGNLYDRLGMHGLSRDGEPIHAVRDFVLWQVNERWRWPNFNIADSLLVCGAGLLLWHAYRTGDGADESPSD